MRGKPSSIFETIPGLPFAGSPVCFRFGRPAGFMRSVLLTIGLILAASSAFPSGIDIGTGFEVQWVSSQFTGTYTGITSSVDSSNVVATRVFADWELLEVYLRYALTEGSTEPSPSTNDPHYFAVWLSGLGLGAAIRIPIRLGGLEVFPIAAAEYTLNLSFVDDKGTSFQSRFPSGSLVRLGGPWIYLGAGFDFATGSILRLGLVAEYFINPLLLDSATLQASHPLGSLAYLAGGQGVSVQLRSSWSMP